LPDKPKISVPTDKQWAALSDRVRAARKATRDEMQEYFDERSEAWQERLDALEALLMSWDI